MEIRWLTTKKTDMFNDPQPGKGRADGAPAKGISWGRMNQLQVVVPWALHPGYGTRIPTNTKHTCNEN